MTFRSVLWNRLDVAGSDACRISDRSGDWLIEGAAVFVHGKAVAHLYYSIAVDAHWATKSASVSGWIDEKSVAIDLQPHGRDWTQNQKPLNGVTGLLDVDLGFTPASNTNALRRLKLKVGEKAETMAVWLDTSDWAVKPLRQIYARRTEKTYFYASPAHGYQAELEVDDFGIVTNYPGLWRSERL